MSLEALAQTPQEEIKLPEVRLPFELWEMYRLSDIRDRVATGEYLRYSKTWGARPTMIVEDIKFLLELVLKLSGPKA
jgi:hypothetical protein